MTTRALCRGFIFRFACVFAMFFIYSFFRGKKSEKESERETDIGKIWRWGNIKRGKIFSIVRFRRFARESGDLSSADRVSRTDS